MQPLCVAVALRVAQVTSISLQLCVVTPLTVQSATLILRIDDVLGGVSKKKKGDRAGAGGAGGGEAAAEGAEGAEEPDH